jgi:hypothetical protein
MHRCSTDPAYAQSVDTPELPSLMRTPVFGWRTDNTRLLGWSLGRRPLDDVLSLAQTLDALAAVLSNP